jgi:hypothetical protein
MYEKIKAKVKQGVKAEVVNDVKLHVQKYQAAYLCGAVSVATAGFTTLLMRGRYVENPMGSYGQDTVTVRPLSFLSNRQTVVTVVAREGRGHPGYIVRCLETGNVFVSQNQAADAMNIPKHILSKHLTGEFADACGWHLERLAA